MELETSTKSMMLRAQYIAAANFACSTRTNQFLYNVKWDVKFDWDIALERVSVDSDRPDYIPQKVWAGMTPLEQEYHMRKV